MLTTFHIVKAMVFPVVMYGCERWTIKKVEWWRIDAFKLWCWIRLLRVPWTVRRSNESILKEINPEYSLEGLMLKLQYFGHLMWKTDSLEKTLMLGKTVGRRRRGNRGRDGWMSSPTPGDYSNSSIELMMPSNHLILCHPLFLLPAVFPSIRVFSKESVLCIRWPKYWSFSFSISPSNEYSGLISLRMD